MQSTFQDDPLLRNGDAPQIEVHVVPSREPSTGFGEIALPAIAPAVGNAVFAATGVRVRRLPFVRSWVHRGPVAMIRAGREHRSRTAARHGSR